MEGLSLSTYICLDKLLFLTRVYLKRLLLQKARSVSIEEIFKVARLSQLALVIHIQVQIVLFN